MSTPHDAPNVVYATGPRILLVGAHRAFLEALAVRLGAETGMDFVRIATGPEQIGPMLGSPRPDVVVIESDPATERVAGVVARVRGVLETAPVVVMSTFEDADVLAESLLAGARGWVDKDASVDELVHALRIVLADGLWLPPDLLDAALHALLSRRLKTPVVSYVERLTRREREVLEHLAAGHSRPEIAEAMSVSPDTVRTHIQNILKKAEVHSTVAALAKARRSAPGPSPIRRQDPPDPTGTVPRRSIS